MFTPSGSLWITSTCGPGRGEDLGRRRRRPSRSRSRGRSAARPRRRSRRARADARGSGRAATDRRRTGRSRRCRPSRAPRSARSAARSRPRPPSSSLRPFASRTFRPLSSAGLWDAETMIPAAKSPVPARNARAGVGTQPAIRTSAPRLVAPAAIAATNMSPDRRVSWPTTSVPALADEPVGRRPAEGVGERRLQLDVRDAADPVGPEEARHVRAPPTAAAAAPAAAVTVTVTVGGSTLMHASGPAWRTGVGWSSWAPTPRPATSRLTVKAAGSIRSRSGDRAADRHEDAGRSTARSRDPAGGRRGRGPRRTSACPSRP